MNSTISEEFGPGLSGFCTPGSTQMSNNSVTGPSKRIHRVWDQRKLPARPHGNGARSCRRHGRQGLHHLPRCWGWWCILPVDRRFNWAAVHHRQRPALGTGQWLAGNRNRQRWFRNLESLGAQLKLAKRF